MPARMVLAGPVTAVWSKRPWIGFGRLPAMMAGRWASAFSVKKRQVHLIGRTVALSGGIPCPFTARSRGLSSLLPLNMDMATTTAANWPGRRLGLRVSSRGGSCRLGLLAFREQYLR
jgi:hypothetical protein